MEYRVMLIQHYTRRFFKIYQSYNTRFGPHLMSEWIPCENYMMSPLVLYTPSFEAVSCFIYGRRRDGYYSTSDDLSCPYHCRVCDQESSTQDGADAKRSQVRVLMSGHIPPMLCFSLYGKYSNKKKYVSFLQCQLSFTLSVFRTCTGLWKSKKFPRNTSRGLVAELVLCDFYQSISFISDLSVSKSPTDEYRRMQYRL